MNTWTSAAGIVFVLAHVRMVATGDNPGAQVGDEWYPLSAAEASNLGHAVNEYYA